MTVKVSRIRPIRRALLKLAMWGDPEAKFPTDGWKDAENMMNEAESGSLEARGYLERAYYCRVYLMGEKPEWLK